MGTRRFEAGVVAEDFEGEAAGCGGDSCAGDGCVDGGDQRGGVDRRAEREGVLQEEEVADVGEVGLAGVDHALEDAEVDEGGGFEGVGDGFRIARMMGKLCRAFSPWMRVC